MKLPHWEYYLSLVGDLEQTSRYVEIAEENFQTFSLEFTRLLLATGSEVDVVAKLLCRKYRSAGKCKDINDYREILKEHAAGICDVEVAMPRYNLTFVPWEDWKTDKNPDWWKAYNNVKHQRDHYYKEANMGSCLKALAGLCVLVAYLDYERISEGLGIRMPIMFLDSKYNKGGHSLFSPGFELPDFKGGEKC